MPSKTPGRAIVLTVLLLLAGHAFASAQDDHSDSTRAHLRFGGQAVGVISHVTPAVLGRDLTEGYVTQPALMGHATFWGGALELRAMLNLEGWTLERGELNAGIWGESYIDRRHPHTYLHEAVVIGAHRLGALSVSVSAGKGFVPFGTDDPMVRPFVKYPANHHLSQILERLIVLGAVRYGLLMLEGGTFNGDEPVGPKSNGTVDRVGDSWSARGTVLPVRGFELQASVADVASPELPGGGGLDHRKRSFSARLERDVSNTGLYALAEYARTAYVNDGVERFAFDSFLGEVSAQRQHWRVAARYERTVRPEEERVVQGFPFRSVRPPTDFSILGRTRWNIATLQLARDIPFGFGSLQPLVEVERGHAETVNRPAVYEPDQFYGDDVLWTLSFAVRVTAGSTHARMGRYGVARPAPGISHHTRH